MCDVSEMLKLIDYVLCHSFDLFCVVFVVFFSVIVKTLILGTHSVEPQS